MKKLIPYAGYDPEEGKFSLVGTHTKLDINRILELRAQKLTYREIGCILAEEEGRPIKYTTETISGAIYRKGKPQ